MAYSTIDDIRDQLDDSKLVQLTDDERSGVVVESRVERAIEDADQEIDGYVGSRHQVPLSPVPAIIRKYSVDLAIYNLYARRDVIPDPRVQRQKNAIAFLQQLALGKISLGVSDPEGNPPASDAPEISSSNPERLFDRDSLKDF